MDTFAYAAALNRVRETVPLIHCITNYVTVNDCANALLAIGASPIMSDEPDDVADITTICGGLVINIGTLNRRSIEAMSIAGARAAELGHPIVLDPVGAGASQLRTSTATTLMDELPLAAVRGNMSEIKALAGASRTTRGVDVNPADVVDEENLAQSAEFVRQLAARIDTLVAVTGAIDLVSDGERVLAVRNGHKAMGSITGAGCMLSCVLAAFLVAADDDKLSAAASALALHGLAGQVAASRLTPEEGVGSFRTYFLDALTTITSEELQSQALVEAVL